MANVRNGNTFYVDTTGTLDIGSARNMKIACIWMTSSTTGGGIVLTDTTTGALKADLKVSLINDTKIIDCFDAKMVFPTGITVTVTNATATLFLEESQK